MDDEEAGARRQKTLLIVAGVIFLGAGVVAWYLLGGQSPASRASDRMFICSETGQVWEYTLQAGDTEPVYSPFSKKNTGYQAEACYWFKDSDGSWKAKSKPTWVLVKKRVDETTTEKTYCPDCEREVVGHNPRPPEDLMKAAEAEGR